MHSPKLTGSLSPHVPNREVFSFTLRTRYEKAIIGFSLLTLTQEAHKITLCKFSSQSGFCILFLKIYFRSVPSASAAPQPALRHHLGLVALCRRERGGGQPTGAARGPERSRAVAAAFPRGRREAPQSSEDIPTAPPRGHPSFTVLGTPGELPM